MTGGTGFEALAFVFVAGLVTDLATGLGALPFFYVEEISDRATVALWGVASGIMLAASVFGLAREGLAYSHGLPVLLAAGALVGVVLVEVSDRLLARLDVGGDGATVDGGTVSPDIDPSAIATADLRTLVLVLGVLTVHSFPEGVAVGVSFAELGLRGGVDVLGLAVPPLAVLMTVAISVHNVPEGLAVSIPLKAMDVGEWRMVGAAVFSSLPQPIGAVIAFAFVRVARAFLPFGFGFAGGAMIYLVCTEFVPDALDAGSDLPHRGIPAFLAGALAGAGVMVPLLFVHVGP
ncbi:metal transporter family GufA protein [Halarchaeum acidiphilum MH1-52-1]|uniref:Metal transporter family GufA protein n=1 Tax=Halarchaeum acidiphilum MH1-52-1 TaxID=1261545 RepID=U2YR92_9EURY|nr:ZIP family metal transporter [Halarchaeum acidiphilum]GAD51500.1 metal transporter family GufA protein [Halarchaeum acidiphilum MH1-52-1]